ncbi:Abi-alpha family protein [Photobacterium leiognathi]|uniref:Abi-alpha family protein n=1 Tax=Photobacterium leiognathi TaxID=553611 RepID=UPI0029813DC6|nr:Abi-alpha family protein [Photobacterium leiognathi]
MSDKEISISSDGFVLKGDVVDAVTAPITTICKTADNILQVVDNLVGLPTDFLNFHLKTFRESYKDGYDKIPPKRRTEPTLRLGCNVLKNVSYAAEEPEIQKLFARLLLSASDSELADDVHPSYASIISDMTVIDAKVLVNEFCNIPPIEIDVDCTQLEKARSSLIRLGLIAWKDRDYSEDELSKFVGYGGYSAPEHLEDIPSLLVDVINDLQQLKNTVIEDKREANSFNRVDLVLTKYGEDFVNTVCRDI